MSPSGTRAPGSGWRRFAPYVGGVRGWCLGVALLTLLVTGMLASGCASTRQTVGGWFGGAPTPSPTPVAKPAREGRVYYVGVERLEVHRAPNASAEVLGHLSYRDRVTRTKVEGGFAHVKAAKDGLTGWVESAGLVRRRPAAKPGAEPPAAAAPEEEEPAAPEAEETAEPAAPEPVPTDTSAPAGPPEPTPTPRGVAPSIFDAY